MNWFRKTSIKLLELPPVSPDFNLIENIWDIIDKNLSEYHLTNVLDLRQAIGKIWSEIPVETCQNLVSSMKRRLETSIRVKRGTSSKY